MSFSDVPECKYLLQINGYQDQVFQKCKYLLHIYERTAGSCVPKC